MADAATMPGERFFSARLRPLTWSEIVLGVGAVAFLAWVLVGLANFRELLEKNTVDVTLRNIGTGLRLKVADAIRREGRPALRQLPGSNPIELLAGPPAGYLGERSGAAAEVPGGSWYFDPDSRELVYVPRLRRHLRLREGEAGELRWRLAAAKVAESNADDTRTEGHALVSTTPYEWY